MRNLKRALSLALASVMLLGMMVVGSSAASFPDVDDSNNVEAIAVLEAVKVMIGNEKGDFEPDKNVTRNEMAVIMAKLILGTYEADSYVGNHPFTDVPDWASKYVAACYNSGIIAGRSDTIYDGQSTVTAVEAAAMMLRALGYEDLSLGAKQWDQPVAAKANEINLFVGLNGAGNAAMNRDSVAKLALNTLQATMVTTSKGMDVTLADGTVFYSARSYDLRITQYGWRDAIDDEGTTSGGYIQLGEYLYKGKLEKTDGAPDNLGRPVDYKWVYDTEDICEVLKDARYTLNNDFTGKDLYNTLGKTAVDSIGTGTGKRALNVYVDGDLLNASTTASFKANLDSKSTDKYSKDSGLNLDMGNGTRTEIFISDDAIDVCIINIYGGEVDKAYTASDVKSDEEPYVLVDGMKFETTDFQEEDVVAYTKGKDGSKTVIVSMEMATLVEGEVSRVTTGKSFIVNGETYEFNHTLADGDKITTANVKNDVLVYVDANGYMIYKGDASESTDYAYVVSCGDGEKDRFDSSKYTFYAKLLLTDGTLKEVTLKDVPSGGAAGAEDDAKAAYNHTIVTYTEDDGKYKLNVAAGAGATLSGAITTNSDLAIEQGVASMELNGTAVSADSNTVFLVCNDADDEDYDVYVGFKNVPDIDGANSTSKVAYATKQGIAKVVYVEDASVDVASDADMIVIIGDKGSKLVKDGSDEYYEFDAVIDGEITTVKVDKGSVEDSGNPCYQLVQNANDEKAFVIQKTKENSKGFITSYTLYTTSGDYIVHNPLTGTKKASNDVVGFDYNGTSYTKSWSYADTAQVVYRDEDGNLRTGGISLIRTDENDSAIVVLEKNKIIGVFVQEVDAGGASTPTPGFVSSDPATLQPLVVGGTAADMTTIDWTSTTEADTSSLNGKTLNVTVPGVERAVLKFEITFTTSAVAADDNTQVQVYAASTISFKAALDEAEEKLQAQADAYAAEKEAAEADYVKVTAIAITGKANMAISGQNATGTLQAEQFVEDTNTAPKPDAPTTEPDDPGSDETAPTLSSATINGTSLVLTYSEALKADSVPAASDFTVKYNGTGKTVSTVAVSGTTVTLTMTEAAANGDTVTVSYTPDTNKIQDAAGNAADALSDEDVTNNTPAPGDEISAGDVYVSTEQEKKVGALTFTEDTSNLPNGLSNVAVANAATAGEGDVKIAFESVAADTGAEAEGAEGSKLEGLTFAAADDQGSAGNDIAIAIKYDSNGTEGAALDAGTVTVTLDGNNGSGTSGAYNASDIQTLIQAVGDESSNGSIDFSNFTVTGTTEISTSGLSDGDAIGSVTLAGGKDAGDTTVTVTTATGGAVTKEYTAAEWTGNNIGIDCNGVTATFDSTATTPWGGAETTVGSIAPTNGGNMEIGGKTVPVTGADLEAQLGEFVTAWNADTNVNGDWEASVDSTKTKIEFKALKDGVTAPGGTTKKPTV